MIDLMAVTTRGLESVSADEMGRIAGLTVSQVAYRRVHAVCAGELADLLRLRTVDDVFLHLAAWEGIVPQRSALAHLTGLAGELDLARALPVLEQIRPLGAAPRFSVTANFVGRRKYSADEIKEALAAGIRARFDWPYVPENESEINIRAFIEHARADVGLRLAAAPMHRRAYKQANLPGSLKPTVAAAMLHMAGVLPGESVLDPFCGVGTILIEAALFGAEARGGDNDPQALAAAGENAARAEVSIAVEPWDARQLPLDDRSVARVVTNLPWGRQVEVEESTAALYRQACAEIDRVLTSNGQVVALTNLPNLLHFDQRPATSQTEISLFGQKPTIVRFAIS
ncbi:MAG: methyltransferase domain-containing protein [Chloroflexi bacterium]|nr:methyltransferase domain-containing protein [Chloroflexota bacterium]